MLGVGSVVSVWDPGPFDKGSIYPAYTLPPQQRDGFQQLFSPGSLCGFPPRSLSPLLGLLPVTKRLALPRVPGCIPGTWFCPQLPPKGSRQHRKCPKDTPPTSGPCSALALVPIPSLRNATVVPPCAGRWS